jgi:hypothetical protein
MIKGLAITPPILDESVSVKDGGEEWQTCP